MISRQHQPHWTVANKFKRDLVFATWDEAHQYSLTFSVTDRNIHPTESPVNAEMWRDDDGKWHVRRKADAVR